MNRTIKFRGKSLLTGTWLYGLPVRTINGTYVVATSDKDGNIRLNEADKVDEDSIGEYTNTTDNRGREIYEGDILEYYNHKYVVECDGCDFRLSAMEKRNSDFIQETTNGMSLRQLSDISQYYQVIGNTFDNKNNNGHE